jgi:hypothetical protein
MKKELNKEDKIQLKRLWRKACKLCHPDIVGDDFKEEANKLMKTLNEVYANNDIEAVQKILYKLEKDTKPKIKPKVKKVLKAKPIKKMNFNIILIILLLLVLTTIFFFINSNSDNYSKNIWKDPDTGLIWQDEKYIAKENQAYNKRINYKKVGSWKYAKKYCKDLSLDGYDDWRLPNINSLRTILRKNYFPNSQSYNGKTYIKKPLLKPMAIKYQWFWSNTNYKSTFSKIWIADFNNGNDGNSNISDTYYIRCVR